MTAALPDLNLRHLRAAIAVVERGTVNAAAADVHLSQPALTQGIARLEAILGTALFIRRPDGMTPTSAGLLLAGRATAVMRLLADAMRAIRAKGAAGGFRRADMLVTMPQVRALVALARDGSYVAAARATGVSQPAIHRAIRDITQLCGVALVERRGRGVALTAAGVRLARACRLALGELRAGIEEIAASGGEDGGRIAIGAMPLARAWLLPAAIARFHAVEPRVAFDVGEGSHAELIEPLRDGEFDLLVGALRDPSPGPDLVQRALFIDRLAIFGRHAHPLPADPSIAALARQPWLAPRAGTPLRALWEAMFADAGLPLPPVWIECGSVMMLRSLMLEGDFLTLLSPDQLWLELRAGLLRQIAAAPGRTERSIGLTMRAAWRPTAAQARFVALLRIVAVDGIVPVNE